MGQQEKTKNSSIGDLVVKCLPMEVEKGRIDANVIASTRSQALQFSEDADGISSGLNHICL